MSMMTLEEAAAALGGLTPEEYLEMMTRLDTLQLREGLPEAPASVNFRMRTADGTEAQFTLRDMDEDNLFLRFARLVKATKKYGGESAQPLKRDEGQSPVVDNSEVRITSEVDASVTDGENVERFEVSQLEFNRGNKTDFIMVKGGVWQKYGWRAYPEIVPPTVSTEGWTPGVARNDIPPEMRYAFVDKTEGKRKIVAFAQ